MITNKELFDKVKFEAEVFYNTINYIHCPYLKTNIVFNAKGLDHIKMKTWNKSRSMSDQYFRLKFLKLVPGLLQVSGTLQDFHEKKCMERLKTRGKWQFKMIPVKYYGFIAIFNNIRIKIIVKKIDGTAPYFWSVIPFWKTRNDVLTGQIKKVFHDGDLEND